MQNTRTAFVGGALLALAACSLSGVQGIGGEIRRGENKVGFAPIVGAFRFGNAPTTLALTAEDGTECGAFDFARGIVATAAHCADSENYGLSDGRSAALMRRGAIKGLRDEIAITNLDVALLLPSSPGKKVRVFRGDLPPGTELLLVPPGDKTISCPLEGQRGDTLFLKCKVIPGWSGSPVYIQHKGKLFLVGMLSGYEAKRGLSWAVHYAAIERAINSRP